LTCYGDCVPAVNSLTGEILSGGSGKRKARQILEQRDGPCPPDKDLCRHTCDNDSMARNGFVCTLHTVWGTAYENKMDQSPETRAHSASAAGKIGGKIGGRIAVESGRLASIASKGANSPHSSSKVEVTCPHCGKTGTKLIMARWHFDRCKFKPEVS
jgi:hypothetical protein